ncbi:MAG: nucleotidyltransferase domain-containing protein [Candidatus Diapherotrites archaeon]|nr:nucleotidyltransferase domain-containing protein [Candidatus Diapherotrites archaeon]
MFEEYAGQKILELFFENPFKEFHLRGVAKESNFSAPTAKTQLDKFVKEGFIEKKNKANLVLFKAITKSKRFQLLKTAFSLEKIEKSKLLDELNKLNPSSIVLFGSTARGEDSDESDLDLLIISKNKKALDLTKFEKKLKREINYSVYSLSEWSEKSSSDKPFYQRILIEGIALKGELPVVE